VCYLVIPLYTRRQSADVDIFDYDDAVFCRIAVRVIRSDMSECAPGELGNIVVK